MTAQPSHFIIPAVALLFLALITLPYIFAAQAGGADYVFGGFLINPYDGNSYLAKMYEGWRGEWRFTLPYTAQPGKGAYLFIFYILLGHLARLVGLPLALVFHFARLAGALALLWALYRFLKVVFPEERERNLAFVLAALGSGLGWLALPFGGFTSDFWVVEAYPFLSAYATPHFAFGLALLLYLLAPNPNGLERAAPWVMKVLLASLLLSALAPFGVVVALVALGGLAVWELAGADRKKRSLSRISLLEPGWRAIWVLLGGGPLMFYDLWAARADPILAGWNAQNLTPSPPVWDLILSLSPALLLALPGALWVVRRGGREAKLLVAWAGPGLLLLYLPLDLQRRFIMGLFVPIACLAVIGLRAFAENQARSRRSRAGSERGRAPRIPILALLLVLLSLPTNLMVLLTGQHGVQTRDPLVFMTRPEYNALAWLSEHTPEDALVLASPRMGMYIPARTGRRVIYGHPFETVNALGEKAAVEGYFSSGGQDAALLAQRNVDYVYAGPRERLRGFRPGASGLNEVYSQDDVSIYAVEMK